MAEVETRSDARYNIVARERGWGIAHDGFIHGEYLTKEAALEAAVSAASEVIQF